MKFGADLKNSVVPEWAPGYIAYDALKAQIKAISGAEAAERDALEETLKANRPGTKGGDYHLGGEVIHALRKITVDKK